MDLKPLEAAPTDEERAAVDAVLGPPKSEVETVSAWEAKSRRTFLLPALTSLQTRVGCLTAGGLGYACQRLGVPPAEGYGVASFYALLALGERPRAFAHVCDDLACRAKGAEATCASLTKSHGPALSAPRRADEVKGPGAPSSAQWARSPCLGLCEQAPAALVTVASATPKEQSFGNATPARIAQALEGQDLAPLSCHLGSEGPLRLLARAKTGSALSLEGYLALGGYGAMERAYEMGRPAVVREVTDSKLQGRGGAAFPTGRKWDAVANAPGSEKYIVCNADESEPGTFKDRALLEGDPFAVIEGMTLAAYATGATRGYLYIRGEYPLAIARLTEALKQARAAKVLGPDVQGQGYAFDIELRRGAGAYICGEETALFASIEGYRGEPRSKPPFPVHQGVFRKPTCINNVETLVAALDVVRLGAVVYGQVGTAQSPGTKLFCVSGAVTTPGVYEVPFGTPLQSVLSLAGGVTAGRTLTGVLLGGVAGGFVGPGGLSLPLSFEGAKAAGVTLGSGVVFVLDDATEVLPLLRRIAEFFRDESCGQCVPCRVGTVRQEELLARLVRGAPLGDVAKERALLKELGQAMRDASICGLGHTASSAVESAFAVLGPLGGQP